jgi:2-polyprenyl-3-methyl-5-hydroxy-6-metoxy-1,4-benzoquinol methylase
MVIGTIFSSPKFYPPMEANTMSKVNDIAKWDDIYRQLEVEEMPWFNPRLDHDIVNALSSHNIVKGNVLDIGTGPGTQAIDLAKRRFKVTAIDISKTAIHKAAERAKKEGIKVNFLSADILNNTLGERFNLVIDRGCFHVIDPTRRAKYVRIVHDLIKAGGYLFLKCFSLKEPPGRGPYRFKPKEITELFEPLFKVGMITESSFKGALPRAPKALFCIMQKRVK